MVTLPIVEPNRLRSDYPMTVTEGASIARMTPPSRLFCANGLRTGADGRIYVAQVSGSQISAVDPDSGAIETICAKGGPVVGPDDLAFDSAGNLFVTEISEGRVSMLRPNGTAKVIHGDMPVANPVTVHQDRVIAGECRPGGRIMELDRDGGAPRLILADVPLVNAFEVGPDGKLYFPVMGANEIWRVSLDGGPPEVVTGGLAGPDSVKFAPDGSIVSTQVASGEVLRIDPRSGARTVLATIAPGLDNCTFLGERLFVSSISGQINEVLSGGRLRSLVPDGLQWPLGLAVGPDGTLFVADGGFTYTITPGGGRTLAGMLFSPGFPGYARGVAAAGAGEWIITTAGGDVARYDPSAGASTILAHGFEQLYGVARRPDGLIAFADLGSGRVMVIKNGAVGEFGSGLDAPKGVAFAPDGSCYVTASGSGKVVRLVRGQATTVLDGLLQPEGIAIDGSDVHVVDAGAKTLLRFDLAGRNREIIAGNLPVGAPPGIAPKPLKAFHPLCGAMGPFAAIAIAPDGTFYLSGDAEGSVLAIRLDASAR